MLKLATIEFRFGAVVLIEKLVFNVAYEKIGVAGSILVPTATANEEQFSVNTNLARRSSVSELSSRLNSA